MKPVYGVALIASLMFACSHEASAVSPRAADYRNATVAGVIALPSADATCEGLGVKATVAGTDQLAGRTAVHQSRGRCSYEVYDVPSNMDVTVQVAPPASWQCKSGQAAQFEPAQANVKLNDRETKTLDFRTHC